ncbi:MAG: hypothetical protein PF692_12655 [Kiritimatiellae bacterium]|nr:hypothetical protein [Kiritimatiellia bacterium]
MWFRDAINRRLYSLNATELLFNEALAAARKKPSAVGGWRCQQVKIKVKVEG